MFGFFFPRRRYALVVSFGGLLLTSVPIFAADIAAPSDALVMRPQMLFDDGLNKNAYSVLVPDKWKMQGQVTWAPKLPTPYFDLSVSDPVQHAAWRQFPRLGFVDGVRENWIAAFPNRREEGEQRFAEGQMAPSGYEIRKIPTSPKDYILTILAPKYCKEVADAKDLTIVSETDLPEFAKAQSDADPLHRPEQSARIRMNYTAGDAPIEREFVVSLCIQRYPDHQGPGPSALWFASVTTCRAPKGKLDPLMPTFAAIGSSVKPLLPWFNQMTQTAAMYLTEQRKQNDKMLQDQRDAINERMRILQEEGRQASEQVSDRIRENFAAQQQAKSDSQREFMHYINGTESFKDSNDGSSLTLYSNYKYQYEDNHGDIIQTNDATFQPPVDPSTSWQQMERAK